MSHHTVSDHALSDHTVPRELLVVAALRQVAGTVGPDPVERERMRRRVMAEFPSVVHEGNSPVLPLRASRRRRWVPGQARGRLMVAAAAGLCLLMSLSGMSFLLSRDALPGDALYTVKRSAESAELGLTFGDQPKALKHLEFAGDRVSEIEIMANQADAAGNWSAGQGKFLRALDDFDSDATAGARLLTGLALGGHPASLSELRSWADQQKSRLTALRAALPLPISARLDSTLGLLDRVVARASALSGRSNCVTITSGTRDDLGLVPARDACKPSAPVDGTSSAVPSPDVTAAPSASPPSGIMLPNLLLRPPPANSVPVPAENGSSRHSGLPATGTPGGVLSNPSQSGAQPLRPQPWRPLPGHDSPQPAAPLPPWILQPRLLPPG
ncbi:MAG: hypothetical protein JO364_16875 [Pseudonocardiales bacterium]|nr:hypothetical protein [Pseudonocardiales bacterium]MBV9031936.1 hypothetical protein [Pseudonocardiales bacterium]